MTNTSSVTRYKAAGPTESRLKPPSAVPVRRSSRAMSSFKNCPASVIVHDWSIIVKVVRCIPFHWDAGKQTTDLVYATLLLTTSSVENTDHHATPRSQIGERLVLNATRYVYVFILVFFHLTLTLSRETWSTRAVWIVNNSVVDGSQ